MKGVPFFNKKGTFSAKMVYEKVKGWTSGWSLSVLNFAEIQLRILTLVHPARRAKAKRDKSDSARRVA